MPAPATVHDFLELVQRSRLLQPADLAGYVGQLRQGALPERPDALAGLLVRDGLLTPFQAEQLLRGRCRGFVLGQYRILERLGTGGMGTVYKAEHLTMGRPVALKVLPPERAEDPACVARFCREARAVAVLEHANIVRAYDVGVDAGLYFLALEYVDGVNLQDLVERRGPLAVARAAEYARQAALGLQHAHAAGLVHRDVKPANLLVNRAGVVKILDLGLARFFNDETDSLTKEVGASAVLGSADYLAPEQALDSHGADIRADLYGLGGTLFFLLAGRPPFAGGSLNQKLIYHQIQTPPSLRGLRPEVPEGLAAVVARMLAKRPQDRYPTPAEAAAALAPWVQGPEPPPAPEEMPPPGPARPHRASLVGPPSASTVQKKSWFTFPSPGLDTSSSTAPPTVAGPAARTSDSDVHALDALAEQDLPAPAVAPSRHLASASRRRRRKWALLATLLAGLVGSGLVLLVRPAGTTPLPAPAAPAPLAAPVNLRAAASRGAVELTWEHRSQQAGFRIERAADAGFTREYTTLASTGPGVTRHTDRPPAGKPCYYRVLALEEGRTSAPSAVVWPGPGYAAGLRRTGLVLNGGAAIAGKALRLTDGKPSQVRSAFFHVPLDVRAFTTAFRFRVGRGKATEGFTFCIQRAGPSRRGSGGGLGYQGIRNSLAVKFDLRNNSTGLVLDGEAPLRSGSLDLSGTGIDLHSGRAYDVVLLATGSTLAMTITDAADRRRSFRTTFDVEVPFVVGAPAAYAGFTASSAAPGAVQEVLSWTWTSLPARSKPGKHLRTGSVGGPVKA
jgi:serine/threonine protein kinase